MSLTAIINLAERLLNKTADQPVEKNSSSRQSQQASSAESDARIGDQFTSSTTNLQDAGPLQVRQINIFSLTAATVQSPPAVAQAKSAAV
jgi:hypothetical protein